MKKPLTISVGLFLFLFCLAFAKATHHSKAEQRSPASPNGYVKAE